MSGLIAFGLLKYVQKTNPRVYLSKDEAFLGTLNFISMYASNFALKFVPYPTQALAKSCKILPVMFFGIIRGTYSYDTEEYIVACFISIGLVVFNMAKVDSYEAAAPIFGYVLLFTSLFFDGYNGT